MDNSSYQTQLEQAALQLLRAWDNGGDFAAKVNQLRQSLPKQMRSYLHRFFLIQPNQTPQEIQCQNLEQALQQTQHIPNAHVEERVFEWVATKNHQTVANSNQH
jgi:hypothetical protein